MAARHDTVELTTPCPHCKSTEVTKIYRPEVYEFSFYCRTCAKGFN